MSMLAAEAPLPALDVTPLPDSGAALPTKADKGSKKDKEEIVALGVITFVISTSLISAYFVYKSRRRKSIGFSNHANQRQLDWAMRYKIIEGIARGLLYLHEDSRLRIVHRDLKTSNILLDQFMNPKISDVGLAKHFDMEKSRRNSSRIVGTNGYIAPEYVRHGHFSTMSDVFSYGVIVLEIVTGRQITKFNGMGRAANLLSYTWKKWNKGMASQVIDPTLGDRYNTNEALRCIQLGLISVQDEPRMRPTMASVVLMLNSDTINLSKPSYPAFFVQGSTTTENYVAPRDVESDPYRRECSTESKRKSSSSSIYSVPITELDPR